MRGERIRIRGTVQGVGFRPLVARLARARGLAGFVRNDGDGVLIGLSAGPQEREAFVAELLEQLPPLANVEAVERLGASTLDCAAAPFAIVASDGGLPRTDIAPDAALCAACRHEVLSPVERRFRYPFTNCTHCGPRYSIVTTVPYDRANTTMAAFSMCDACRTEYEDETDRRFHAQPIACFVCGPKAWLERADGRPFAYDRFSMLDPVDAVGGLLLAGEVVAVKGVGGFHLMVDATREATVQELRRRKRRDHKPFALMARDIDVVERYATLSDDERRMLLSPAAPIVLLSEDGPERLPSAVAPDSRHLGFMLPYTPLHLLLMRRVDRPVVCTSGNLSDEPQCIDNEEAKARLGQIADWFLFTDRSIRNRVDDSVVKRMAGEVRVVRRARGYAPEPFALPRGLGTAPPVLALGGQYKSTVVVTGSGRAVMSPHLGDLDEVAAFSAWQASVRLLEGLYAQRPVAIAVDLHPEYRPTEVGRNLARARGLELLEVQHHHAHIAACLAEHGRPLDAPPVLGIAFDGLGYGLGGELWGGEFMVADYAGFERVGTLKPVALLGGDRASREPWRNLYAHLMAEMGWAEFEMNFSELEVYRFLAAKPRHLLEQMLETGTQATPASSAGRLFDAVAAAVGLHAERIDYEGQAAMALEALALPWLEVARTDERYPLGIPVLRESGLPYIEPLGMWRAILGDVFEGTEPGRIAARFHLALADAVTRMALRARKAYAGVGRHALDTVVLTGGVFQNQILLEESAMLLERADFSVLLHRRIPPHDGGLSLGQAAVASARLAGPRTVG